MSIVTITPLVGSVVTAGLATSQSYTLVTRVGALTAQGKVVRLRFSLDVNRIFLEERLQTEYSSMTANNAPFISPSTGVTPLSGALSLAGIAMDTLPRVLMPVTGDLAATGNSATIQSRPRPDVGSLALSGVAPSLQFLPQVMGVATVSGTSGTSKDVTFGTTPQPGDLLLIFGGWNANTTDMTAPDYTSYPGASGSPASVRVISKWAVGGETGATVTWSTSASHDFITWVVRYADPTSTPETIQTNGTSTSPDPGNLTPSWGARRMMWVAAAHGNPTITVFPAELPSNQLTHTKVSVCSLITDATLGTLNPSAFTGTNGVWRATTIAILGM